jgi:integrase
VGPDGAGVIGSVRVDQARMLQRMRPGQVFLSRDRTLPPAMLTTLANVVRPEIEHQPEAAMVDVTPPKLTFTAMLDEWFGESNVPEDRQRHIRTIFDKFATMLGHDDATRVDTPAVNNFKKLLLATPNVRNGKPLTKNTVKQLLSPIKTAYQYAVNNGLGGLKVNPARSITVEGVVVGTRDDFTKEEERTILTAARDQRKEIRWFTWLMATVGCSNKEAVCASRDDFSREGDRVIWDLKGTETDYRARAIPLHSALIAEGFEDWLNSLQPTQALFSELRIGAKTNDWIKSLGISKTVYSFRHGMKTKLRSAMMPSDERNYYQGHAAADVAATYGTNLATTLAVYIERIPAPLSALRADTAGAL